MKIPTISIAFASDLHLAPFRTQRRIQALAFPPESDVIILAGDIAVGMQAVDEAFELAERYPATHIVWIAGNHEHYGQIIEEQIDRFRRACANHHRIHFLENESVKLFGITFIGCTLWSDFSILGEPRRAMEVAEQCIADFTCIQTGNAKQFTPRDAVKRFNDSCRHLKKQLSEVASGKAVVVTHFSPGMMTHNPLFPVDAITGYFQANVNHLIDIFQPEAWVYGHNHYSNDLKSGRTRIVSNQLGYPSEDGYIPKYDPQKLIVLEIGADHVTER